MSAFFLKLRAALWPIQKEEHKKFFPLLVIFFLISFNYNLLRAAKDTIIVTAPASGAEALPFIKVWAMFPMAIFLTYLFTKLSNKLSREKVFYILVSIFIGFFFLFTFCLYPARDFLHPTHAIDTLATMLPAGFQGFLAIFRNWTFTAFYVMSELWGAIILTVLFWGFANEITTVLEAKRFYALLGVGANIAGIISGQTAVLFSQHRYNPLFPLGHNSWEQTLILINCAVIIIGILILFAFKLFNDNIFSKEAFHKEPSKEKLKTTLRKNFSYVGKSKYLICIALIVITYHIAINLVEIVWKNQVKMLYPDPNEFNGYMGKVLTMIGIFATIIALCISIGNMLKRFSWTLNALITPFILLTTGLAFFSFFVLDNATLATIAALFGTTPLAMNVFIGSFQNCVSRACKYTLFDATKEISFIPLSIESKRKGKAAIDGVGSRIGKSGGSLIHQSLLLYFCTLSASSPYISIVFFSFVGIWISAVISLGKQFNTLVAQNEQPSGTEAKEKKAMPTAEETP